MHPKSLSAKSFLTRFNKVLEERSSMSRAVKPGQGQSGPLLDRGAPEWTNALLNIVLDIGESLQYDIYPSQYVFNPKSRRNSHYSGPGDSGEWLYDACWTRYPNNVQLLSHLRSVVNGTEPLHERYLDLACESEWGGKSGDRHIHAVVDDFAKLVECRAPLKVMIFGYRPAEPGTFAELRDLCGALAKSDTSSSEYLLLGWEFDAAWSERLGKRGHYIIPVDR